MDYAKKRGIKVCLGFQLDGVPDDAHIKDVDSRLRVLVPKYPSIDYVWFWQCRGASIEDRRISGRLGIPDMVEEQRALDYLTDRGNTKKEENGRGGRMAIYIQKAYDALKAIAPSKTRGDLRLGRRQVDVLYRSLPGLDKILPKDIIFSALDNIDPSWEPNVSEFYGRLPEDRERWAIPWWESDGGGTRHDQFMPQCNVKPFSVLLPDVMKKGCKGVLGIHWRTRAVEEVARYMVDFAWNPQKTNYETFYADFARRSFGEADAAEMSKILMELEGLGPRWTGGGGQEECRPFTWMAKPPAPKPENLKTLQEIRGQLQTVCRARSAEGEDAAFGSRREAHRHDRLGNDSMMTPRCRSLKPRGNRKPTRAAAAEMLAKAPLARPCKPIRGCFARRAIGACWPRST